MFSLVFPNKSPLGKAVQEPPSSRCSENLVLFVLLSPLCVNEPSQRRIWPLESVRPKAEWGCPVRLFLGCADPSISSPWIPNSVTGRQTLLLPRLRLPVAETRGAFLVMLCKVGLTDSLGVFRAVPSTLMETSLGSRRARKGLPWVRMLCPLGGIPGDQVG